jgi:hypothetical protein
MDVLAFAVLKDILVSTAIEALQELSSDHLLVYFLNQATRRTHWRLSLSFLLTGTKISRVITSHALAVSVTAAHAPCRVMLLPYSKAHWTWLPLLLRQS